MVSVETLGVRGLDLLDLASVLEVHARAILRPDDAPAALGVAHLDLRQVRGYFRISYIADLLTSAISILKNAAALGALARLRAVRWKAPKGSSLNGNGAS